jgi:pimeloyl-ACP methyl ester carboxylesterase
MPMAKPAQEYVHRFETAGSLTLHVAELPARRPPAILMHGIGMDWRVWQATSRRLGPHFHLYLVDLRGHGQSDKPDRGYSLAHYAADIEDLVDRLGLKQATVIGSSLGGMVAAAMEVPEDIVSRRILVDPPLTGGPVRDPALYRDILRLKHESTESLEKLLARLNPGAGAFFPRVMAEMWRSTADGVVAEMLEDPHYFDVSSSLRWNTSPTLLLQGDPGAGGVLTDAQAAATLKLLSRGELIRVPGAGHAIHADKPVEFTRIVLEFTSRTSACESAGMRSESP